MIVRLS